MKRVQLFEFEDQQWFPNSMRIALTKLIVVLHKMIGLGDVMTKLISDALKKSEKNQVVDLGSGAGGPMPEVMGKLAKSQEFGNVRMILTDLFPNKEAITTIERLGNTKLSFQKKPVDATHLEKAPEGLKTMINSFHHMNPTQAKQILHSAYKSKQPILIYEMAENKIPLLIWWLMLPLSFIVMIIMVLFMTPFVRPMTFKQIFFTYIIPVIPLFYAWDGQASMPRIYTLKDVDELLEGLSDDSYIWEKGPAKKENGKSLGYYLFGMPTK